MSYCPPGRSRMASASENEAATVTSKPSSSSRTDIVSRLLSSSSSRNTLSIDPSSTFRLACDRHARNTGRGSQAACRRGNGHPDLAAAARSGPEMQIAPGCFDQTLGHAQAHAEMPLLVALQAFQEGLGLADAGAVVAVS